MLVYFFAKMIQPPGVLTAIEVTLLFAHQTTPMIIHMDHFSCLALLAAHCYAPSFSERWLALAAKTTLAYDIHHSWPLAPLATHWFATHFSKTWLGFAA